jgi:hypothetical protein
MVGVDPEAQGVDVIVDLAETFPFPIKNRPGRQA